MKSIPFKTNRGRTKKSFHQMEEALELPHHLKGVALRHENQAPRWLGFSLFSAPSFCWRRKRHLAGPQPVVGKGDQRASQLLFSVFVVVAVLWGEGSFLCFCVCCFLWGGGLFLPLKTPSPGEANLLQTYSPCSPPTVEELCFLEVIVAFGVGGSLSKRETHR